MLFELGSVSLSSHPGEPHGAARCPFLSGGRLAARWRQHGGPGILCPFSIPEGFMKPANDRTALLVIDVQESFRQRPYWQPVEAAAFIANTQALIDQCRRQQIRVLQVFHQEPQADRQDPFHPESGFVRPMPELRLEADAVFFKEVHSAL